jgi:hypothetical protein
LFAAAARPSAAAAAGWCRRLLRTVRALPERRSVFRVSHSVSCFYGVFVWACPELKGPFSAFPGSGSEEYDDSTDDEFKYDEGESSDEDEDALEEPAPAAGRPATRRVAEALDEGVIPLSVSAFEILLKNVEQPTAK